MPPVNWLAICGRRQIAVIVDIIGMVSFLLLLEISFWLEKPAIVGRQMSFANQGSNLIERPICP